MDGFVDAYALSTGVKQLIPEHWLDHPVLGKDFSLTPSAKARELEENAQPTPEDGLTAAAGAEQPSESWTRDQLDRHAAGLGIDTTSLANKAEVLALIANTRNQTPGDIPSPDQTPAAGENQE